MSLPKLKRVKNPRRPRPAPAPQHNKEVFSHFTLNKDPESSKYLPYDEVAYPSMIRDRDETQPVSAEAELEAMWYAGHLDFERRTEQKKVAKSMSPFLRLPGARMLPAAMAEQRRLDRKKRRAEQRTAAQHGESDEAHAEAVRSHAALSGTEEQRLKELAEALNLFPRRSVNAYAVSNRKMRRAVLEKKPKRIEPTMRSSVLETMAHRYRAEAAASTVIARAWRKSYRRALLLKRLEQERYVVVIQKVARSSIARRFVAVWWNAGLELAIQWQARLRRVMQNRRTRLELQEQYLAEARLHRFVRGFIGRRRYLRTRQSRAIVKVQRLWRGARCRCKMDRRYLDALVVPMMRRARGVVGRGRARAWRDLSFAKARVVQRCWRGWWARRACNEELHARESKALSDLVRFIAAEAVRAREDAKRIEKRMAKRRLQEDAAEARDRVNGMVAEVQILERKLVELRSEHDLCTPRAVALGLRDTLATHAAAARDDVTRAKAHLLFDGLLELRTADEELAKRQSDVDAHLRRARRYDAYREREVDLIMARDSRRFHDTHDRRQRQKVGDERRHWRVRFFNTAGKPARWSTFYKRGVLQPEPEGRAAFSGGTVDLFADDDTTKYRLGSEEAVAALDAKIRLQNWHNQVAQIEALFKPLHKNLQRAHEAQEEPPPPEDPPDLLLETPGAAFTRAMRAGAAVRPSLDEATLPAALRTDRTPEKPADNNPPEKKNKHPADGLFYPRPDVVFVVESPGHRSGLADDGGSYETSAPFAAGGYPSTRDFANHTAGSGLSYFPESSFGRGSGSGGGPSSSSSPATRPPPPATSPLSSCFDPSPFRRARRTQAPNREKRRLPATSRIPWSLLDELEAEKNKFELKKAFQAAFVAED